MKQRFSISRDTDGNNIVIQEYAELDKGAYSLLCEEAYPVASLEAALAGGPGQVIRVLRTKSFFPTSFFAEKLISNLALYLQQDGAEALKIEADDAECIQGRGVSKVIPEDENDTIEDLLDVDDDEIMDDEGPVGKLDAPIKIAEDETAEISNSL